MNKNIFFILLLFIPVICNAGSCNECDVSSMIKSISGYTVSNTNEWATDIVESMRELGIDGNKENICAVLSVIRQESNFHENPPVPNLANITVSKIKSMPDTYPLLGKLIPYGLDNFPSKEKSYMNMIRHAKTEKELDFIYRKIIDDIGLSKIDIAQDLIEMENRIRTIGSMQVSVRFALHSQKEIKDSLSLEDIYKVRDKLYTRKYGVFYGVKQLLDYDTGYTKKIYRFADYNSGRYSSRNSAFQLVISKILHTNIELDGDLLMYDIYGYAKPEKSKTETAILSLSNIYGFLLSEDDIRRDILKEKSKDFYNTEVYKKVRNEYRRLFNEVPPSYILPDITLHSPKIKRRMTTADFATLVNKHYQKCMKL